MLEKHILLLSRKKKKKRDEKFTLPISQSTLHISFFSILILFSCKDKTWSLYFHSEREKACGLQTWECEFYSPLTCKSKMLEAPESKITCQETDNIH